ncbi:hypothetical protein F8388_010946 [Cannabis sativa]|uniref:Uncharacterized protein n=1 Tax=Cannabis sativa TaxID=3483 RepID=A0A7J6EEF3_CANSA|nr:hypothetical protein F8388_010946 [Cannabis sativa]KAF4396162.1 hypothetical protein G4B88_020799 [Cannabis sativa]
MKRKNVISISNLKPLKFSYSISLSPAPSLLHLQPRRRRLCLPHLSPCVRPSPTQDPISSARRRRVAIKLQALTDQNKNSES